MTLVQKTAMDVVEGDVIFESGIRCRVANVRRGLINGEPTARYTLTSDPDATHTRRLPHGFEGMSAGGNHLARVTVECR